MRLDNRLTQRKQYKGLSLGDIPKSSLLSYNKNQFDPTTLRFTDRIGANERTLYPLQYINIGAGDTGYFLNSAMVTAGRTITSTTKNGTTTLSSPSAGRLNATSGTLWDFTVTWSDAAVSSYAYCSLVTATYAVCFDRSGNGRHLVATGFSTLSSVCVSGREYGSDVLNLYGWSAGGLGPELVANGDFSTSTLVWGHNHDANAVVSIENGRLKLSNSSSYITLNISAVAGKIYQVLWEADELTIDSNAFIGTPAGNVITKNGSSASALIVATGASVAIRNDLSISDSYFDNISIKEFIPSTVPIPARTDNPTLDAIGNALTYPGRAKYSIVPKGRTGNCATLASGTSIAITGVTGATVLSKEGTGTVTIGTNVINRATDGTLYNLKLTLSNGRVLTLPLTEGAGTTVFGYDNTGQNYTGTITAADINAFWAGKQTTYFPELQYGCSIGRWSYLDNTYVDSITCTNYITRSTSLNLWGGFLGTASTSSELSPDGVTTGSLLSCSNTYGRITPAGVSVAISNLYTLSIYAKQNTHNSVFIETAAAAGDSYATFNLSTSTVGGSAAARGSMVAIGGGWYRCSLYFTAASTGTTDLRFGTGNADPQNTVFVWGAMLNSGNTALPFIITTTAAATEYNATWPANPYTTGLDCRAHALTAQPLKFNAASDYSLPDSAQCRSATGWAGVANEFYNADGTPKTLDKATLELYGSGLRFYFGTRGHALYSTDKVVKDMQIIKQLRSSGTIMESTFTLDPETSLV